MDKVACLEPSKRRELFDETAAKMDLLPGLIEKDFWVCWTLRQMFAMPELAGGILFKGGTTLSKVFRVIERFSEDIDIAVDYAMLGYTNERSPLGDMSKTKRNKLLEEMLGSCRDYIAKTFIPALRGCVETVIGAGTSWRLEVDPRDPHVVNFHYPATSDRVEYLRPAVRLELGTHAELIPNERYRITPYAAECFPDVFDEAACWVKAIKAERTFWEKATILHQEHYRTTHHGPPTRYSRHYYDVYMLAQRQDIRDSVLRSPELLARVVEHKQRFYPRAWARYDLAVPATLKLLPSQDWIGFLLDDYRSMNEMFFREHPDFGTILDGLRELEQAIRNMEVISGPLR